MSPTLQIVEEMAHADPPRKIVGHPAAKDKYLKITRFYRYSLTPKYEYMSLLISRFWDDIRDRGMMLYVAETDRDGIHYYLVGENVAQIKAEIKRFMTQEAVA